MKLLHSFLTAVSTILPSQSIQDSKKKWNGLAEENGKYYIVSKEGRSITDEKFRELGQQNYTELVAQDQLVKETLGTYADKRALEIGCGIGRVTEFFAADFEHVTGLDISDKMIADATKRLEHINNISFIATDGMHYPIEDQSIDLVFSYIVFQHMPSVEVVKENFKEIRRVLKDSGLAKIQVRGGRKVRKGSWYYGPSFKSKDMQAMMAEVGLEIIKDGDDTMKRYFVWVKRK
jgi:SAM-dependent methyltransferase